MWHCSTLGAISLEWRSEINPLYLRSRRRLCVKISEYLVMNKVVKSSLKILAWCHFLKNLTSRSTNRSMPLKIVIFPCNLADSRKYAEEALPQNDQDTAMLLQRNATFTKQSRWVQSSESCFLARGFTTYSLFFNNNISLGMQGRQEWGTGGNCPSRF